VLEDYLEEFPGVVITVSHDRYFLDKVVGQLIVLKGDGVIDTFYGNYSEFLEKDTILPEKKKTEIKEEVSPKDKTKKKRMSYNEQREFATIEDDIAKVESRLEEITTEMNNTGSDFEKAQKLMEEESGLNERLEHLIERWTYLTELSQQV
jgi:ABC transport system ATP-binding/permease protein